jgi:hypothetical protein
MIASPSGSIARREPERRAAAERVGVHRARVERPTAEGDQEVGEMPAKLVLAGIERADRGIAGKGRDHEPDHRVAPGQVPARGQFAGQGARSRIE